jgi:TonB family protein
MKNFLILLLLSCSIYASGQSEKFTDPSFGEHEYDMKNFLRQNIRYPVAARENGISGIVVASFIIDKSGNVDSIEMLNHIDNSLNIEAQRVIKLSSGYWKPATINDSAVNVRFRISITFSLDPNDGEFRNATYFYNLGVKYAGKNDYQKALYNFDQALIINFADIDALYNAAQMKFKMNDRSGACEYLQKIKALGKPDADDLLEKYCK